MQLGQIMVKNNWISPEQLRLALYLQRQSSKYLGEILVELEWISHHQLERCLTEQYWRNKGYWIIN